jgi:hypothetical protein
MLVVERVECEIQRAAAAEKRNEEYSSPIYRFRGIMT